MAQSAVTVEHEQVVHMYLGVLGLNSDYYIINFSLFPNFQQGLKDGALRHHFVRGV